MINSRILSLTWSGLWIHIGSNIIDLPISKILSVLLARNDMAAYNAHKSRNGKAVAITWFNGDGPSTSLVLGTQEISLNVPIASQGIYRLPDFELLAKFPPACVLGDCMFSDDMAYWAHWNYSSWPPDLECYQGSKLAGSLKGEQVFRKYSKMDQFVFGKGSEIVEHYMFIDNGRQIMLQTQKRGPFQLYSESLEIDIPSGQIHSLGISDPFFVWQCFGIPLLAVVIVLCWLNRRRNRISTSSSNTKN